MVDGSEALSYAVVQKEGFYPVDKQGNYSDFDWTTKISRLDMIDELFKEDGGGLEEYFANIQALIKTQVQRFLAGKSVVDTVSEILGVNFGEDLEERYKHIQETIDRYNAFLKLAKPNDDIKLPATLQRINLEKLKPNARELKTLREQLASSLGEEWWDKAANDWLRERQHLQVEEPEEPEELEDEEEEVASGQE